MKRVNLKIALLHNAKPQAIAEPDDQFEEYDSAETINAIADALSDYGQVQPIEAGRNLPRQLEEGSFDIAFNIAEGHGRRCREAHAAAVCELLSLPYTHSDPLTLALTLDKTMAKRAVSPEVRVPRAVLLESGCEPFHLPFPIVVKPNDEGSSKGIRDDSLASDAHHARYLIDRLRRQYGCPILVEQFLQGPEVTVGIVGTGAKAEVLALMEIAPADASTAFLYSVEAKRAFRERVRYFVPPRLADHTLCDIRDSALKAYRLLGCRDVARLDFRLDENDRPHFLECNPLPGLNPDTSDLVLLSRSVMPYRELVQRILLEALQRHDMATE